MSAPLLDSVVLSDATLAKTQAKVAAGSTKLSLSWISAEMLTNVMLSTTLATVTYVSHSYLNYGLSAGAFLKTHLLVGVVLGLLLVARIVIGAYRVQQAASHVQQFNMVARQMAVMSTFVTETLTVSAGAELEKKATTNFRFELVRLLNLSFYCFQLMLSGMKLAMPPSSLKAPDGGRMEMEVLSAVENPTVMVCKLIADLIERQRAAKRISNEQVSVLMAKVSDLIEAYHASLALVLAPTATSFSTFTASFTMIFVYLVGPVIAVNELETNPNLPGLGLAFTITYTLIISLFYFGLYEAGKATDATLASLSAFLALDEMGYVLSDDLSNLVDDDSVPVFLPR